MGLRHMSSQYTLDNWHVKEVQITTYYISTNMGKYRKLNTVNMGRYRECNTTNVDSLGKAVLLMLHQQIKQPIVRVLH